MGFDCAILVPFGPEPALPVRAFAAGATWAEGRPLAVCFRVEAALDQLSLPLPVAGKRVDRLWEHTCFEAFVAPASESRYLELNFSPSGDWAAYAFTSHRKGGRAAEVVPEIEVRIEEDSIEVDVLVGIDDWLGEPPTHLEVSLTGVLEDRSGALSHWAVEHRTKAPDFHLRRTFVLQLNR